MQDFSGIKKGQILLQKIGEAGFFQGNARPVPSPWAMILWKEVVVEKANATSYWVDGIKCRKRESGNQNYDFHSFSRPIFYLPVDDNGEPVVPPTKEEFDKTTILFEKILDLIKTRPSSCYFGFFMDLNDVDLQTASDLADEIQQASRNLDNAVSELRRLARNNKS